MKNNLDYYRHKSGSHNHPKFKMLRVQYGWSGEGKFWALNNMIAQSQNCKLDMNEKFNKATIANDLDFSIAELDAYLFFLANDCKLIQMENGIIYTNDTQECLSDVLAERIRGQVKYYAKMKKAGENETSTEAEVTSAENSKTSMEKIYRVKYSKVKEIIVNNKSSSSSNPLLPKTPQIYDDNDFLNFTDFTEEQAARSVITQLFQQYCEKLPHKREVSRIFNILRKSNLGQNETWQVIVRSFTEFPLLGEIKRNTQYLSRQIEKRIDDDVGKLRKENLKLLKAQEAQNLGQLKAEWEEAARTGNTPYQQFLKNVSH